MTAISTKIGIQRGRKLLPELATLNLRASQTFYPGSLVAHRLGSALAEAVDPTAPRTDLVIVGCATHYVASNATVDGSGNALDADGNILTVEYEFGLVKFFDTGATSNQLTDNDRGRPCYAYDNNTLYKTDSNGQLSFAGIVHSVDSSEGVRLLLMPEGNGLGPVYGQGQSLTDVAFTARAVATSLGANTLSAGTLTVTANGALASQDGLSMAVGDVLLLPEGLTNLTNAYDAGPYEVISVGGASSQVVLRRPAWYAHGAGMVLGAKVVVGGGGTTYAGTTWRSDAVKGSTIGTDAPLFWPEKMTVSYTNTSGSSGAITTIPIKSLTKSAVLITSTPTTAPHASTRDWRASAITAGALGTASITAVAESAPGTTNTSDVGTYTLTVFN
jgi:hypothetical protein